MEAPAGRLTVKVLLTICLCCVVGTHSFVFDQQNNQECFKACRCSSIYTVFEIECDSINLTRFPSFYLLNTGTSAYQQIWINLRENNLTSVPFKAFGNLTMRPERTWDINLNKNKISSVNNAAFNGFETKILRLDLSENRLTSLPAAFSDLHFDRLNLMSNPIAYFDPFVLYFSAHRIDFFYVSLTSFNNWPPAFTHIDAAKWFINGFNGSTIPIGSFGGSNWNPTLLSISNTNLVDISNILCDLHEHLGELYLVNNAFLDVDASFNVCKNSTNVGLFKTIDIEGSGLTHVPSKLKMFKTLQSVRLNRNNITTITDNDFKGLTSMTELALNDNPVTSISAHAFDTNTNLRSLQLFNTLLIDIPDFLLHMNGIQLHGLSVRCDCKTLHTFKNANITESNMSGIGCNNHPEFSLSKVVKELLQLCP